MSDDLDGLFSEDVETDAETETTAEIETETGDVAAAPPAADEQTEGSGQVADPKDSAFKATALDERSKRQERDIMLAESNAKIAALEASIKASEEAQEAPDIFDNPDAVISGIEAKFEAKIAENAKEMQDREADIGEVLARSKHDDYDEVRAAFFALAESEPDTAKRLATQLEPGLNAGESMYKAMKEHQTLSAVGGIEGLQRQVADLTAKLEAQETGKPVTDVPPDLTTARSSGGDPSSSIPDGNEGLSALLNGR